MNSSTSYLFRVHTACLVVLATVAIGVMLYWLRPVLVPFVLALFFVSGLNPILQFFERRLKTPRMVSVGVTLLLGLAIVSLLWGLILASVGDLVRNGDAYQERFNQLVQYVAPVLELAPDADALSPKLEQEGELQESESASGSNEDLESDDGNQDAGKELESSGTTPDEKPSGGTARGNDFESGSIGTDLETGSDSISQGDELSEKNDSDQGDSSRLQPPDADPATAGSSETQAALSEANTGNEAVALLNVSDTDRLLELDETGIAEGSDPSSDASESGRIPAQVRSFLNGLLQGAVVELTNFLVEFLSSGTIVLIFVFFLLMGGSRLVLDEHEVLKEIDSEIRSYIVAKTLISLATGLIYGLVLWLFGVPLSVVLGLLAFLLNYIPNVGPLLACLLPIPLVVLNPEMSIVAATTVIVLSSAIQFLSGNVIEPKLMGTSLRLDPIAILLALMFWGMTWGIVGMFLATPMLSATKILLEKFDQTRPIADIIAGRPPRSKEDTTNPTKESKSVTAPEGKSS